MSFSTSFLLLALTTTAMAQYTVQSRLFSLVLKSSNCSIDGSVLAPCHEGAGIEGLCYGKVPEVNISTAYYQFNSSAGAVGVEPPSIGEIGILTYELRGSNFNLSSPLSMSSSFTSNVGIPLFTPSDKVTYVAFDADGKMNIQNYLDDTVYPAIYKQTAFYRWFVCNTNYGYAYATLAWVIGPGDPENPTCQKVDVVRVFA